MNVVAGAQRARRFLWRLFGRRLGSGNTKLVEQHFTEHAVRKLHIGCGANILGGWLNSDLNPYSHDVLQLDATRPLPFDDGQFDYVFSEHMIEHISYAQGQALLAECHRVLREGGKLRISTPDLSFLIDLYREDKSALQRAYVKWATDEFVPGAPGYVDTFVINNFVRAWGHRFIYDEKTLRSSLERAGFIDIVRCGLGESREPALQQLENETRMPAGFLKLETLTLEGMKAGKA